MRCKCLFNLPEARTIIVRANKEKRECLAVLFAYF